MQKWCLPLVVVLVALSLSGCGEKSESRRILTPAESDLQEFVHEIEVVDSDAARLRSDVERVRKILLEMEQSLDRVNNSTREINKTIARLQGRPVEDEQRSDTGMGRTISWIIALLLLLVVTPIFVLKYLQTRQETRTWSEGMQSRESTSRSTDSELVDAEFTTSSDTAQESDAPDSSTGDMDLDSTPEDQSSGRYEESEDELADDADQEEQDRS